MRKPPTAWRWPPIPTFTFANVLRLLLGLWVLNAPLLDPQFAPGELATRNQLLAGGCIVLLATLRFIFVREAVTFRWAHLLLGTWTFASPWVFDFVADEAVFWNSTLSGALIVALATWSLIR